MGRLGLVAAPGRTWRPYAAPVAFLLAATLVVAIVRSGIDSGSATSKPAPAKVSAAKRPSAARPAVYVVRPGDTLTAIAGRTGVPVAKLGKLNPGVSPTALFIGEKIHLR